MSDLIKAWHRHQLMGGNAPADGKYILMGCPIWGAQHVGWFFDYGLPSLMAPLNRKALDERGWHLVLYVEAERLEEFRARLDGYNVPAELRLLPTEIMALLAEDGRHRFALLAAVHNLLIHEAGRCGAGFHMMLPDHVVSRNFVPNFYKLTDQYNAIAQTTLTAVPTVLERLEQRLVKGKMSSEKLMALAWEGMTDQWRSWSMDGIEDFSGVPLTDFIHWRTQTAVRMHCAHMNAMWIAAPRCRRAALEYGGTIDSELPQYMAGPTYVPLAKDDVTFIALSTGGPAAPIAPVAQFKQAFMDNLGKDRPQDFLNFFAAPCEMPISPADGFPTDAEVESRFQRFMVTLEGA